MRPMLSTIEIPERPRYIPGSGPPMAPITLQPDDRETGWVIAGTVEFKGVSQYVVTPKDNPAHRRPVEKQHILDWVSPKAHEDFEYAQYKRQADEEWERDSRILAKAAAIKERRHAMGLVKERVKSKKPFAKYMQLEQVEDSDRANTSGNISSSDHSNDELNREAFQPRVTPPKRKHSVEFLQDGESSVKRRGLSSSRTVSVLPKSPSFKPRQQRQDETTEDEDDGEHENATALNSTGTEPKLADRFYPPILPLLRPVRTSPKATMVQKSSLSPYSAPPQLIPANASPSKLSPKLHWSVLGPPIRVSVNISKAVSPRNCSNATTPNNFMFVPQSNHSRTFPPILLPSSLIRPPVTRPISGTAQVVGNGTEKTSNYGISRRKHQSLSSKDKNFATTNSFKAKSGSTSRNATPLYDKEVKGQSQTLSNGRWASAECIIPKQKKNKGSRPSSSRSFTNLRWPSNSKSPKFSSAQSSYFAGMKMKEKAKELTGDDDEKPGEEVWDIHGILDDEMRLVNDKLIRYYLCAWAGDYDPTWEPEENISSDALKRYEKKKKRADSHGFDGAADIDVMPESREAWNPRISQRLHNVIKPDNEESSFEGFADALTDATLFLASDETLLPRSGPGTTTKERKEWIVSGAE